MRLRERFQKEHDTSQASVSGGTDDGRVSGWCGIARRGGLPPLRDIGEWLTAEGLDDH